MKRDDERLRSLGESKSVDVSKGVGKAVDRDGQGSSSDWASVASQPLIP